MMTMATPPGTVAARWLDRPCGIEPTVRGDRGERLALRLFRRLVTDGEAAIDDGEAAALGVHAQRILRHEAALPAQTHQARAAHDGVGDGAVVLADHDAVEHPDFLSRGGKHRDAPETVDL